MIRALVLKELREIGWIAALGLAAYLFVVGAIVSPRFASSMGFLPGLDAVARSFFRFEQDRLFPFVHGNFSTAYVVISVAVVMGIGFRQTLGENRGGTYSFLLHRPVPWRTILFTKMAVALVLYLIVAAIPVLLLAAWAATPGTHPSPFEWSMTEPIWRIWIAVPLFYLAAFLCGIRTARWFGTRALPLAAALAPLLITMFMPFWPFWLLFGLEIFLLSVALLVTSTLHIAATQDFS